MTTTEQTHDSGSGLRKAIGGRLLFVFILGDVLGAGVYALVGVLAGESGGAFWVPLLVALGLSLLTAASYAELVTKYPRAGGAAVFAHRAYGRDDVAFLVGFSMLAAGLTSVAGLSLAFAGDYLGVLVDAPARPAAVLFLLAVAALNARGISESLRANLVMTVVEVTGLLVVVALGLAVLSRGDGDPGRVLELPAGTGAVAAVLGGALIAFYSFVGFETSANVAEEMRRPARDYPRALLGGLVAAGVVYLLVALTVSAAVPTDRLVSSSGPLLEVVRVADVGLPPSVFSVVALVAVANGALLTSIMTSRLTYGMATDGLLPSTLSRLLPGRRTPVVAIAVTTAASAGLALTGDLGTLAETVVLLLLVVFISTNGAAIVLRRDAVEHDHFTAPRIVPWLALLSCAALLTQQSAGVFLRAALLLAVGVALYALTRLGRSRRPASR